MFQILNVFFKDVFVWLLWQQSLLHGGVEGAQSAGANFKESYLRNEHCYWNEIWWLFIKYIGEDNGVLIRSAPIKPLPWQPLFSKPTFDNFNIKFFKMHFYFKFPHWTT